MQYSVLTKTMSAELNGTEKNTATDNTALVA